MSTGAPPDPPLLTEAAVELSALIDEIDEIDLVGAPGISGSVLTVSVKIDTRLFEPGSGGLAVEPFETIRLTAGPSYPTAPPIASVDHLRWLGFPHVLVGNLLCLFLDPDREWDPATGMAGAMHRLWGWFEEAVGGRFDARSSLFHALGGVPFNRGGDELLVIGDVGGIIRPGIHRITIAQRTSKRFDVTGWGRAPLDGETQALAIIANDPLALGLGNTLADLIRAIDTPVWSGDDHHLPRRHGFPSADAIAFRLGRAAGRLSPGEPLRLIIGGRNPALRGPGAYDLAVAVLEPAALAAAGLGPAPSDPGDPAAATLRSMQPDDIRAAITTRRDHNRPVHWYDGKWIHLLGCGALGSWIGEQVVRSGAARVTVADPRPVRSGILVRQNYTEDDVGVSKAEAIAARLRTISDGVVVEVLGSYADLIGEAAERCDLVIDASVSQSGSAMLDALTRTGDKCPPLAQVATDSLTSTLGIVTVAPAGGAASLVAIQQTMADHVANHAELEDFARFWDPDDDGMFAPARGCSVPTFRGSAADAMGIAGSAISLLGPAAGAGLTGGFLFALPHTSASVPARTWVPHGS